MNYVIGLDYGTDSCRAIIVEATTGKEVATAVKYYPPAETARKDFSLAVIKINSLLL